MMLNRVQWSNSVSKSSIKHRGDFKMFPGKFWIFMMSFITKKEKKKTWTIRYLGTARFFELIKCIPFYLTNLFIYVLVIFLICVFQNEKFNRFLWFLASLINDNGTLRNCYLFSCRYKNLRDIGIYLKSHFYEKCK